MKPQPTTIGINHFYRRQTIDSKYSYFSGTDEELLKAIEQNFPLRRPGRREGSWIIPLSGKINKNAVFYTPVVRARRHMLLNAECLARSKRETGLVCATGVGKKERAKFAQAILYSRHLLKKLGEKTDTDCDFEVVSVHGSDVKDPPEHPYDIARAVLNQGADYDPKIICEAILYWARHVYVKPRFTRHIDKDIARLIANGHSDKAVMLRRKRVPDETKEDAVAYIDSVQHFMHLTGRYYD